MQKAIIQAFNFNLQQNKVNLSLKTTIISQNIGAVYLED